MFYDAAKRDHGLAQDPLKSLIVPRPIGWISTVDGQGRVNLAPYSFYNGVSEIPPMVYFAITGTYGDTPTKHSRMNAEETGEFVVNMVAGTLKREDEHHHRDGGLRHRRDEARGPHAGALQVREAAARCRIAGRAGVQVLEDDRAAGRAGPRGHSAARSCSARWSACISTTAS